MANALSLIPQYTCTHGILFNSIHSPVCPAPQVLVAAEAPSREGSQTDVTADPPSFSDTKPTRSDQEERLFNRLQDSLSSKIPLVTTPTKGDSGENKGDSVSPSSTISSSGEVRGEYVINSGGDQQEERSQGEESHEEEEEDDDESFHSEGDCEWAWLRGVA